MARTLIVSALLLCWASAGCYTYTPVPVGRVSPQMIVRVETEEGQRVERLEGQVFEVSGNTLSLLPEVRPGMDDGPRVLRFAEVRSVTERRLHTGRTLAVLGGGVAVGIGVLLLAEGEPSDTRDPPGGGGGFNLIPVLSSLFGSR